MPQRRLYWYKNRWMCVKELARAWNRGYEATIYRANKLLKFKYMRPKACSECE